jgi:hypothetical protein
LANNLDLEEINTLDSLGRNALIWAIVGPGQKPSRTTRKIVKTLARRGVYVWSEDNTGLSALDYASFGEFRSRSLRRILKNFQ